MQTAVLLVTGRYRVSADRPPTWALLWKARLPSTIVLQHPLEAAWAETGAGRRKACMLPRRGIKVCCSRSMIKFYFKSNIMIPY
jgi:hypothetical protein